MTSSTAELYHDDVKKRPTTSSNAARMTNLAKYSYRPLRHGDSIRLIHLQPSDDDSAPIKFSLLRARLSDANLDYEALSYTWGAEYPKQTIFCQNPPSILEVTQNCYSALKRLRNDSVRVLWIDAVCINQEEENEKSIQVRMMDRVFAIAARVIVDLGEETPGSCLFFNELAEAEQSRTLNTRREPSPEIIHELECLFRRPWFSRVWVIQEVVANPTVMIICGNQKSSWDALRACQYGYSRNYVATWKEMPPVMSLAKDETGKLKLSGSLWRILLRTRSLSANDPRDKVFALLSLLGPGLDIREHLIDYNRSCEAIFTDVALLLLKQVGLEILLAARYSHARDMPSWVPDWSQKHRDPLLFPRDYYAGGPSEFEVMGEEPSPQGTKIEANQFGTVQTRIDFKHPDLLNMRSSCKRQSILKVTGVRISSVIYQGAAFSFSDQDDASQAFLQILEFFRSINPNDEHSSKPMENEHLPSALLAAFRCAWPSNVEFGDWIMRGGYEDNLPVAEEDIDPRLWLGNETYFSTEKVQRFQLNMQDCRFFVSEGETVGIAPENAQEGDSICIIKGAFAPCILRQINGNQWSLVSGDCYLCRHHSPFPVHWVEDNFDKVELWNYYEKEGVPEDFFIC
ncbi:heterokaryon incompatibility protein-domain-containing protein [Cadophora sp. MPI-SDFR-AT-0126]|nr:heterokaryon incompatibility protein-domain-containing protein [Leotiomycetes sp. MPI-SDFR-AT-0126]